MPGAGAMHHGDATEDRPLIIEAPGYRGPERRRTENEWRRHVESRLTAGAEVMARTEKKVDENTALTIELSNSVKTLNEKTSEMVSAFDSAKAGFKFLESFAKIMRPIGMIAAAAAAIWGFFSLVKGGTPPKP